MHGNRRGDDSLSDAFIEKLCVLCVLRGDIFIMLLCGRRTVMVEYAF
jgi:hypothetical protein